MASNFLRTVFLGIATVLFFSSGLWAQQQVGAVWSPPSNQQQGLDELDRFADLGVGILVVKPGLGRENWTRIDSLNFKVYGNLSLKYPTVSMVNNPGNTLLERLGAGATEFIAQPSVTSIGIFSFGQTKSSAFKQAIRPLVQQIDTASTATLFYTTLYPEPTPTDTLFDFKLLKVTEPQSLSDPAASSKVKGYMYSARDNLLEPVKRLLEQAKSDSIPIFFEGRWLLSHLNDNADFEDALRYYAATGEVVFPLPEDRVRPKRGHTFLVVLLLMMLGTLVLNYQYSPVYKKTISRYFLAHKFLVNDVMDRHIRTITPALVILFQHVVSVGIVCYCLGEVLVSEAGWEAVQHHYQEFFLGASPLITLFLFGCSISLITHLFSILWIRLTNKKVTHFSQVLLLYSWPLQLNFIFVLLIAMLMLSGPFYGLIYLCSVLFAIIFLGAFIITAFDTSNYLNSRRAGFLLSSIGIYSVIWIVLGTWLASSSQLWDVLSLAASMP